MAVTLIAERPEYAAAVDAVLDRAFGPGRFAKASERARERGAVLDQSLSRVAVNETGEVVGVCRIWRAQAGAPVHLLGPLAVDPAAQAAGVGLALARDAVAACRASGSPGVVLVGAEQFFRPLGFTIVPRGRVTMPGPFEPNRLLWLELKPGGLDAVEGELGAPSV